MRRWLWISVAVVPLGLAFFWANTVAHFDPPIRLSPEDRQILQFAEQGLVAETIAALERREPPVDARPGFAKAAIQTLLGNSDAYVFLDYMRSRKDKNPRPATITAMMAEIVAQNGEIDVALALLTLIPPGSVLSQTRERVAMEMVLHDRMPAGFAILDRVGHEDSYPGYVTEMFDRALQKEDLLLARAIIQHAELVIRSRANSEARAVYIAKLATQFAIAGDVENAYRILKEFPETDWPDPELSNESGRIRLVMYERYQGFPFGVRSGILAAISYGHARRLEFDDTLRVAEALPDIQLRDHVLASAIVFLFREEWPEAVQASRMDAAERMMSVVTDTDQRNETLKCRAAERSSAGDWAGALWALGQVEGAWDWFLTYVHMLQSKDSGKRSCLVLGWPLFPPNLYGGAS